MATTQAGQERWELEDTPPPWWVSVLVGLLAILAGILALVWPKPTLLLVGLTFGIVLVAVGIADIASSARSHGTRGGRLLEGILGLVTVLAGLLLIVRPGASVLTVAFILGFWWLLVGTLQLAHGISTPERRGFNIGFGLLGIVAGVIIVAQPAIGLITLVYIVAISFLLRGALLIMFGFALRRPATPPRARPAT